MALTPKDAEKAAVLTEKNQLLEALGILDEASGCTNAPIMAKEVPNDSHAKIVGILTTSVFSTVHQPASIDQDTLGNESDSTIHRSIGDIHVVGRKASLKII